MFTTLQHDSIQHDSTCLISYITRLYVIFKQQTHHDFLKNKDNMEQEILQAILKCIENYPEGEKNKNWFIRLVQNSLHENSYIETDRDLIYNATNGEQIISTLLAINIKTVVKIRMVYKIINATWEENKWDINLLNNFILQDKPTTLTELSMIAS